MNKRTRQLAALPNVRLFVASNLMTADVVTASYRKHTCQSCKVTIAFASQDNIDPNCPNCGSEVVGGDVEVTLPAISTDQLSSVACEHCHATNVLENDALDVLAGKVHCASCANPLHYILASEDDNQDENPTVEDIVVPEEPDTADPVTVSVPNAAPSITPADLADAVANGARMAADAAKGVPQQASTGDITREEGEAKENGLNAEQDYDPLKDAVTVDVSDIVEDGLEEGEDADFELIYTADEDGSNGKILALLDDQHVMTLSEEDAGDNSDIMDSDIFQGTVKDEVSEAGLKALAHFGFKPVTLKVPVGKVVAKRIAETLTVERNKVQASLAEVKASFEQRASIAATALSKGFYRNRTNPLQDTLIATLKQAGFPQAELVVKRAMSVAGLEFVKAMIDLAEEYEDRSVESLNELSDTLSDMSSDLQITDDANDNPVVGDELKTTPEQLIASLGCGGTPSKRYRTRETAGVSGGTDVETTLARLHALRSGS